MVILHCLKLYIFKSLENWVLYNHTIIFLNWQDKSMQVKYWQNNIKKIKIRTSKSSASHDKNSNLLSPFLYPLPE